MKKLEPIAIVGIGCRFPGGADSPEAFWRLVLEGRSVIQEIPPDRFDLDVFYDPRPATPGRTSARHGGFLEGLDLFDAGFFDLSPREAERLDPQQRLLLETAVEAFDDAGQPVESLSGTSTGVFVGMWLNDFEGRLFSDPQGADFYMTTGTGRYAASGRLSYVFGLQGPSLTVDTACSSSLTAVHLACQSLRTLESDLTLAGAANTIFQPHVSIAYSQSRMLAADGFCKFGDARADGYVRSEGAAVLVMKRLSDALRDGDRVRAVIRGSAVNNDGVTSGFMTTPGRGGQEQMLRRAYSAAGVDPGRVQYVEAHGTGTIAGDPVELGALGRVLGEGRDPTRPLAVGSVKTNIGHTEGAAGLAGLIKAALALEHRTIPASLHFESPNPAVEWDGLNVYIPRANQAWPQGEGPATAGVSSFGIAGTNAHVVLEEAPESYVPEHADVVKGAVLLPLSAASEAALRESARRHAERVLASNGSELRDLAFTAARRRSHRRHRLAVTGSTPEEVADKLFAFAAGEARTGLVSGLARAQGAPIVFVFPGQGSQWLGMGRELIQREPAFREALFELEPAIRAEAGFSLEAELLADPDRSRLGEIDVVQPVLFAIEVALAALYRSKGVEPSAVVGHSMGEVAAALVAGALPVVDAVRVICKRSALLRRTSGQGAMAVVGLSTGDAARAIVGYEDRVSIAVSNAEQSTVISGDPDAVDAILGALEKKEIFCRRVKVDVASHSPQMDPLLDELRAGLASIRPRKAAIPIWSTVEGRAMGGEELDAEYWVRNMRQTVLFAKTAKSLHESGHSVFVEMSPHPILVQPLQGDLEAKGAIALGALRREEGEQSAFLESLGALHVVSAWGAWERLYPLGRLRPLPAYPWQRERFWHDAAARGGAARAAADGAHPLLGSSLEIAHRPALAVWENVLKAAWPGCAFEHRLGDVSLLGASGFVELAVAASQQRAGPGPLTIEGLVFREPLILDDSQRVIQVVLDGPPKDCEFSVWSKAGTTWTRHASARLRSGVDEPAVATGAIEHVKEVDGGRYYAELGARGLRFHESTQGMTWLALGPGRASARVQPPPVVVPHLGASGLHPAALDACFQLAATADALYQPDADLRIPTGLRRIRLSTRPVQSARLELVSGQDPGSVTLHVLDDHGAWVASFEDVSSVALGGGRRLATSVADVAHEVEWRAAPISVDAKSPFERWWVLGKRPDLVDAIARGLREKGATADCLGDLADLCARLRAAGSREKAGVVWVATAEGDALSVGPSADFVRILRAAAESAGGARVWAVTTGAQTACPGFGASWPSLAPIWGLAGVAAAELPDVFGGVLDLDPAVSTEAQATSLVAELARSDGERALAIRNSQSFVPRLVRRAATPGSPTVYRRDAAYVITGGLGGIGLRVALRLAERGVRRLILLGRRGLPPRAEWLHDDLDTSTRERIAVVRALEGRGIAVHVAAVNVGDEREIQSFLEAYRSEGWPPIRGVFHAAGSIEDRLLTELDAAALESAFAAKARGAMFLDRALAQDALDFFVLFSSVGSVLGQPGQGNYAAANAFLDALAHDRRARGLPGVSINWGVWSEVGLARTEGGRRTAAALEEQGIGTLSAELALDVLEQVATDPSPQIVAVPTDWARLVDAGARIPPFLELVVPKEQTKQSSGSTVALGEELAAIPVADRRGHLERRLQGHVAAVLKTATARVELTRPLRTLGLDSLMALELRRRLEAASGLALSATLVWNHPTVSALASYIASRLEVPLEEEGSQQSVKTREIRASQEIQDVAALSEEEALAALLHGRAGSS